MRKTLIDALQSAPWLAAMARVFEKGNAPLFIVGGAVRNPLMGLPISDVDVCGPLRPEAVMSLCEGTEVHAVLRAAHFGTVELFITGEDGRCNMAEYTTFREDSYRCGHKPDSVKFTTDIAVDALRRDFSVNALYRRVYSNCLGDVIDPTGGLAHLAQLVLHTTTEDPDQVLKDDGLRILRAARFQAELDLLPTAKLMESLTRYAYLLRDIVPQRIGEEIKKIMLADLRYPKLSRRAPATASGLMTLHRIGAWEILFDGIAYDEQSVNALAHLRIPDGLSSLAARLALLLRNADRSELEPVLRFLNVSIRDIEQVATMLIALHGIETGELSAFDAIKLGKNALFFAQYAFEALHEPQNMDRAKTLMTRLENKPKSLKDLAINGNDLIPIFIQLDMPKALMGSVLEEIWRMTIGQPLPNEKETLLRMARQIIEKKQSKI